MADAITTMTPDATPRDTVSRGVSRAGRNDAIFHGLCFSAAMLLMLTLVGLIVSLVIGGWPALSHFGFKFFISSAWDPVADDYGAAGPIVGTIVTAVMAMVIALPLAIGIAVFLVEFCPKSIANTVAAAVDSLDRLWHVGLVRAGALVCRACANAADYVAGPRIVLGQDAGGCSQRREYLYR